MFVPINLNNVVRFTLTDKGVDAFEVLSNAECVKYGPHYPRRETPAVGAEVEWRLHEFMHFFGTALFIGSPEIVKDCTILVDVPNDVANAAGS